MRRAFKYRIYPTKLQTQKLEHSIDLLRDIYNAALQERREAWRLNRINITFFEQSKQIPEIRRTNPEYLGIQARTILQTLRQVDKAFKAFFRRVKTKKAPGFPRFKGRAFFNSIIYNQTGYRLVERKLTLSLIGNLRINLSRPIEGKIKEVVIKREGSRWFAIISCDDVLASPLDPNPRAVGIDVGIESFATLSDGTQITNWRLYEAAQKKLRIAQRRVARRKKGSNRRKKAVTILREIHRKIFNQRHDFQHKASIHLVREYGLIAVEALNIAGLQRGRLSKQITDASWSSFIHKLTYKAERAGRKLVEVAPHYTSQDCSTCGHREKKGLSVRVHNCSNCGLSLHRDHNAALNILSLGLSGQALTCRATESVA